MYCRQLWQASGKINKNEIDKKRTEIKIKSLRISLAISWSSQACRNQISWRAKKCYWDIKGLDWVCLNPFLLVFPSKTYKPNTHNFGLRGPNWKPLQAPFFRRSVCCAWLGILKLFTRRCDIIIGLLLEDGCGRCGCWCRGYRLKHQNQGFYLRRNSNYTSHSKGGIATLSPNNTWGRN